jgi:hypothetical protein
MRGRNQSNKNLNKEVIECQTFSAKMQVMQCIKVEIFNVFHYENRKEHQFLLKICICIDIIKINAFLYYHKECICNT